MKAPAQQADRDLPQHIVIIMDGNGRWARARARPRIMGHRAGVSALREVVRECRKLEIPALTVFAFSSENWRRPRQEVGFLMDLFISSLTKEIGELAKNNVCLRVIGDRTAFPQALQESIANSESATAGNDRLVLTLAANYGGQWDIVETTRKLAVAAANGELSADAISTEHFSSRVALADLPDPDLFIRTGGEQRISNFLLWQLAYTELYFTDELWPDFSVDSLHAALADYAARQRRFGRTAEQVEQGSDA